MGNGAVLWQKISILPGIQRCPAGLAFIVKVESWNTECFRAQIPARRSPAARWAGVWTADCWRTEPWRWRIAIRWGSVCVLKWIPLTTGVSKPAAYLLTYHFGAIYTLKIGFFRLFWGLPLIYHSWQPCNLIPLMTDNWSWYFISPGCWWHTWGRRVQPALHVQQDAGDGQKVTVGSFIMSSLLSSRHHHLIILPTATHCIPPAECWCCGECL